MPSAERSSCSRRPDLNRLALPKHAQRPHRAHGFKIIDALPTARSWHLRHRAAAARRRINGALCQKKEKTA